MFHQIPRLLQASWPLILLLVACSTANGEPTYTRAGIQELIQTNHRDEALLMCREYAQENPGDAVMLYNLACLENSTGHTERAMAAYAAAVSAGFSEWQHAAVDPDLQGDIHPAVLELNAQEKQRLTAVAADQQLTLDLGQWSAPRTLTGPGDDTKPVLRLRWQDNGLECELTANQEWGQMFARPTDAPLGGRSGLRISLALLSAEADSQVGRDTTSQFLFAFGRGTKGGIGGLFIPSRNLWQPVREMAPKIRLDEQGTMRLTALVPWALIAPYHPVTDTPLGIEVVAQTRTPNGQLTAALVDPEVTQLSRRQPHVFAPLRFNTDSIGQDLFVGKLSASISQHEPLVLELTAISTEMGPATLTINFLDQAGRSVLPHGSVQGNSNLTAGTNHITRQVDFSGLTNGGYLLRAQLTFPSGRTSSWETSVLQLSNDWRTQYDARLVDLREGERATVRYLLDTAQKAVAELLPRRNPGPIVTSLFAIEQMFANAQASGTILPNQGVSLFVFQGPNGKDQICHLYLPAGRQHADGLNPVLVLHRQGTRAASTAARIGRNYEYGDIRPRLKTGHDDLFPVYLVPELSSDPDLWASEAQACVEWARREFAVSQVAVVGTNALGRTALELLGRDKNSFTGLLIFAGRELDPDPLWPYDGVPGTPITWLHFSGETAAGRHALQQLKDHGMAIAKEETVPGGLTLTQAADRVVRWAENLR